MPAICKAQTTKQAKASFKARGRPSLSDKEQRQLERSIELEGRVERAKEAKKRRAEAARKRAEKERREKAEKEKSPLLSQRRCDKFGFKASQFHLGAFFGKPKTGIPNDPNMVRPQQQDEPEDVYEDDGLDDEELLKALELPNMKQQPQRKQDLKSDSAWMPPPPLPRAVPLQRANTEPIGTFDQDSFWDELESSTQIARELDDAKHEQARSEETKAGSFSSEDFDLTAEDLDELDPPKSVLPPPAKAPAKMPPPAIPAKPAIKDMPPPPPMPTKRTQTKVTQQNAIRGPFLPASSLYCSPELGFTLTQLENFVEDDLQLTQAVPG